MNRQSGSAILSAMLTVALVATFTATAMWQQFRSVEVETAERARVQAAWLSTAALDWARLVLREDARVGTADHLTEPWAALFDGVQLSAFISADNNSSNPDDLNVSTNSTLTGQIIDLQSRLNVSNLIDNGALSAPDVKSFTRLFDLLGLPVAELSSMANQLLHATATKPGMTPTSTALPPQRVEQLVWVGLSASTLAALQPYITLLPERTPVNLNTASAEVIYASATALPLSDARKLLELRYAHPFRALDDANRKLGDMDKVGKVADALGPFTENRHAVGSSFFEIRTRLKLNETWQHESATVQRQGTSVRVILRHRGATAVTQPTPTDTSQATPVRKLP